MSMVGIHLILWPAILLALSPFAQSATEPSFGSVVFSPDLKRFAELNENDWNYDYAPSRPFLEAFEICQRQHDTSGFKDKPYITGCFFRSTSNITFDGMYFYSKDRIVKRILLNFRNDKRHNEVFAQLIKSFGEVNYHGEYSEEASVHKLAEWQRDGYRIVYDYGGVNKVQPIFLIYETMPVYPDGFNPPITNLDSLKGEK